MLQFKRNKAIRMYSYIKIYLEDMLLKILRHIVLGTRPFVIPIDPIAPIEIREEKIKTRVCENIREGP